MFDYALYNGRIPVLNRYPLGTFPGHSPALEGESRVSVLTAMLYYSSTLSLHQVKLQMDSEVIEELGPLDYLINEVYRPFIVERVNVKQLIPKMPCMRDLLPIIYTERDPKISAQIFLKHLKEKVEDKGKYQMFKDALGQTGYEIIVQALDNKEIQADDDHIRILNLFHEIIEDKIEPSIIAESLFAKDLITLDQLQEIKNLEQNKSQKDAVFILLDSVPRRKADWFHTFLEVLYNQDHRELVKTLDDKFFSSKNDPVFVVMDGPKTEPTIHTIGTWIHNLEAGDVADERKYSKSVSNHGYHETDTHIGTVSSSEGDAVQKQLLDLKKLMEHQQELLVKIDSKVQRLEEMLEKLMHCKDANSPS
ncbi:hypothetical protein Btru_036685 [Bulinus truncatus]|nr:hypothetical protein Btru_036685 [Bulinus truncatus]